jgi:hypothetical protein
MGYKYDVFLSYKQKSLFGQWTQEVFYPEFEITLPEALGREASVFIDKQGISTGTSLAPAIKHAIAHSRCLVAVWSSEYFRSDWCKRELYVMLQRERLLGYRTSERPSGLVLPIKVFDGEHFPKITDDIFQRDFTECAYRGKAFFNTEKYLVLQEKVRIFSYDVAKAIRACPAWCEAWIEDTTFDNLITEDFSVDTSSSFLSLDMG